VQTSVARTSTVVIKEKPKESLSSSKAGELKAKAKTKPSLSGVEVHFYKVSNNGNKTFLGKAKTNSNGHASATFDLTAGKTYTLVAKVVGLSKSKYISKYSKEHSQKVKG
jgi:hypothetical protein